MTTKIKPRNSASTQEDYCTHYPSRDDCEVGKHCSCNTPVPSSTHYECAYGPCEGHKCEKCGRFL